MGTHHTAKSYAATLLPYHSTGVTSRPADLAARLEGACSTLPAMTLPAPDPLPPTAPPLLVIAGPTASGKTALAIALAQKVGGEIVSSDSRQIYKRCDIVTAKPTAGEQELAPHHLLDIAEPHQMFSAAQWAEAARQAIAGIQARGQIPIVCGGTGFYIRALVEPQRIAAPVADEALRQNLEHECDEIGLAAMHARLQELAPKRAEMTHPNDRYRIVRALEIALSPPRQEAASTCSAAPLAHIAFRLSWPRQELYARIEARVDAMIAQGAWDELRGLLGSGVSREAPALSGVGYRQMIPVLEGAMSEAEGIEAWKRESRRYAKRQESWFANQMQARALDATRGAQAQSEEVLQVLAAASTDAGELDGGR